MRYNGYVGFTLKVENHEVPKSIREKFKNASTHPQNSVSVQGHSHNERGIVEFINILGIDVVGGEQYLKRGVRIVKLPSRSGTYYVNTVNTL